MWNFGRPNSNNVLSVMPLRTDNLNGSETHVSINFLVNREYHVKSMCVIWVMYLARKDSRTGDAGGGSSVSGWGFV